MADFVADDYTFIAQRLKQFADDRRRRHGAGLFQHPLIVASQFWYVTDGLRTIADFQTSHGINEYKQFISGLPRTAVERMAAMAYTQQAQSYFGREENMKIVISRLFLLLTTAEFDTLTD